MLYRVRQFFDAARAAPLEDSEIRRIRPVLNDAALELFQSMPPGDRRHSLRIFDELSARGHRARPLLQAALLHDVAKRRVGLAHRTAVILLNALAPALLPRVASASPSSWRYPLHLSLVHPARGAELAARAGVDAAAVELIRHHQDSAPRFSGPNAALLSEWHTTLKSLDDSS
jgi:hypothetical protein